MSQEYYLVCDECKKKVHIGCVGFSGVQFWWKEEKIMKATYEILKECITHLNKLKFVWEQSPEDEEYEEIQ